MAAIDQFDVVASATDDGSDIGPASSHDLDIIKQHSVGARGFHGQSPHISLCSFDCISHHALSMVVSLVDAWIETATALSWLLRFPHDTPLLPHSPPPYQPNQRTNGAQPALLRRARLKLSRPTDWIANIDSILIEACNISINTSYTPLGYSCVGPDLAFFPRMYVRTGYVE